MKITLYCIRGNTGDYYVGKAVNLARRLYEHRIGRGSDVTKTWSSFELIMSHSIECIDEADSRRLEYGYTAGLRSRFYPAKVFGPGGSKLKIVTRNAEKKVGIKSEKTG